MLKWREKESPVLQRESAKRRVASKVVFLPQTSRRLAKTKQNSHNERNRTLKSDSAAQRSCLFCNKEHTLDSCDKLKKQEYKDRIQFLKSKGYALAV